MFNLTTRHLFLWVLIGTLTACTKTMSDKHTNRLIHETSPYLLQHAHNPVDWYPWGDEALEKAKQEDKLLLISIGYSSCHWCHVMEHESFEDETVANLMNENFVCIKVDREERPDVDQVYMDAVQLMTGRGGWPLNCFALPDGRPVYGGTYFRKSDWISLLNQLAKLYRTDHLKLINQAEAIQQGVIKQEMAQVKVETLELSQKEIKASIRKMAEGFDKQTGGFNGAPKFPMPSILNYLQTYLHTENHERIQQHLLLTLDQMALGGIYDHVGGGFARYSVDEEWHIPHFEKMLYDNAQLVSVYSKAYRSTKSEHYKRVVYETLAFVRRVLTTPEGAFYSALDADSEGQEGKYYVWTADELKTLLKEDYELIAEYYSVTEEGNWENGWNVLKSLATAEAFSTEKKIPLEDFLSTLEKAETTLLAERVKRPMPGMDDKIITSWNALMMKAYLDAYSAFENPSFLEAAVRNAEFIQNKLIQSDGSLHRSYKNGVSKINGFLDDYGFTIAAFIELYQVSFNEKWLTLAQKLCDLTLANFKDTDSDFFFFTSVKDQPLAVRKKEISDNVIPSSNSVMAENLFLLSDFFGRPDYADLAYQMTSTLAYEVQSYGRFYSNWGALLVKMNSNPREIVIAGPNAKDYYQEIKKQNPYNVIYAVAEQYTSLPIFEGRFVENRTLIYVCENGSCQLPVSTTEEALEQLSR